MSVKKLLIGSVILLAMVGTFLFYLYPIQFAETFFRWDMKVHGVSQIRMGELEVFERNQCSRGMSCQCTVLIHGLGDRAVTWRPILKDPPIPNRRWLAINLPGSGGTPTRPQLSDYEIKNIAKYVWGFLEGEDCANWMLVGNSLGGWIGIEMARLRPLEISHLILSPSAGVKADYQKIIETYRSPTVNELKKMAGLAYYHSKSWLPDFVFRGLANRLKKMPVLQYMKAQDQGGFLGKELRQIEVPTLILWGEGDQVLPLRLGERLHELLPESEFHVLPECGHLPHKECTEKFNKKISDFVNAY